MESAPITRKGLMLIIHHPACAQKSHNHTRFRQTTRQRLHRHLEDTLKDKVTMLEYKEASFYDSYFSSLDGFKLLENFHESTEGNEGNLYIGSVEVLRTIHPLILRVEIPKAFPHMHLTFKTKSLSGYPHLIHTGKTENGDWFCLNTPFAEAEKEQLDLEIQRLKEWIRRQMREDLPAHIKDRNVRAALQFANAYDWENPDEIKGFSAKARLTFVGDFQSDLSYLKNDVGHFHCIKTIDNRFYAFKGKSGTNYELPFIIVDELPKLDRDEDLNILKLVEQYSWDKKICEHLLPDFDLSREWKYSQIQNLRLETVEYSEEEANTIIEEVQNELDKEDSYITCRLDNGNPHFTESTKQKVLPAHKKLLLNKLNDIRDKVKKCHCYRNRGIDETFKIPTIEAEAIDEEFFDYLYQYHSFALGIRIKHNTLDELSWVIISTTQNESTSSDWYCYNLGLCEVAIDRLTIQPCIASTAQAIDFDMFFGRGKLADSLCGKRVAIIGLGAIGSKVAESLAKGGVSYFGLWDSDIVEPGNICRSAYRKEDLGESKVIATEKLIRSINPYATQIKYDGFWGQSLYNFNDYTFEKGSFYGEINYDDQQDAINAIKDFDLIFDCTGSNEMLHFLSYAVPDASIISLCITNHANNLLCISSNDGNPFELRKAYLSRIEQDTKNFYVEGSGCFSPTFLARNCDIDALVNLAIRDIDNSLTVGEDVRSSIWSYDRRGVVSDRLQKYKQKEYGINMTICTETIMDGEDLPDKQSGQIGYILGTYSRDGSTIMVTHMITSTNAESKLTDAYKTSQGIIDYIGDIRYSKEMKGTFSDETFAIIKSKAEDDLINTLNPLLALRNPDGSFSFFLYIDSKLMPFIQV